MLDLGKWDNYISFANNTTIRQTIALLKHSKFHILPDSFLNHASGGFNKKGIVVFGNTSHKYTDMIIIIIYGMLHHVLLVGYRIQWM